MTLKQIENLDIQLMDKHGLLDKGWHFKFDNSKRRLGICKYGPKIIGLSKPIFELNGCKEKATNTILH